MFDLMANVLEERLCTSLTKSFLYQLHSLGGNIYSLNVFFLMCTTATETLVKQRTTFLSLYLVLVNTFTRVLLFEAAWESGD